MRSSLDLSLPAVLGTAWFTAGAPGAVDASIATYLEAGGRVLDSARIYGDSEAVIGGWLRAHGEVPGLQLLTKGGHPDPADWLPRLDRGALLHDARTSVAKLGRPADAYLLHRDDVGRPVADVADTLRTLVDEGLTSAVGVSNWSLDRTRELRAALQDRGLDLVAVSDYAGLARPLSEPDFAGEESLDAPTLGWLEETGIPNLSWSSQSGGWFAGVHPRGQFAGAENVRRRAVLEQVAEVAGRRPESVLARWTATISPVVVPIVASRSPERLARTLADLRDPALDPAVANLVAVLDPQGVAGRALLEPGAVW
ncbi:aldo/keto reductase [Pseudolysinimonas sp.]|uniref:aldo/keto reductase n=1 Tax=Pseudolysinimonas sp. TaxID=2680009 RepID=UPI003F816607